MNEMIDRIAMALAKYNGARSPIFIKNGKEYLDRSYFEQWVPCACAAVEAMREPTKEMLNADPDFHSPQLWEQFTPIEVWQAMIDKVLE